MSCVSTTGEVRILGKTHSVLKFLKDTRRHFISTVHMNKVPGSVNDSHAASQFSGILSISEFLWVSRRVLIHVSCDVSNIATQETLDFLL